MTYRRFEAALLAATMVVMCAPGHAHSFVRPPETNWKPPWSGTFPYQRNIYWNFSVDPAGGASPLGTPGADYEGKLDPVLKASDSVVVTGLTLFSGATSPDGVAGIGIDNRNGLTTLTGSIVFSLDNLVDNYPLKNIWIEYSGLESGPAGEPPSSASIEVSARRAVTYGPFRPLPDIDLPSGLILANVGYQLTPNPDHETIAFNLVVPAGHFDVFNTIQIATQSVPEPATWVTAIAGFGLIGYGIRMRKRTQARVQLT